MLLDALPPGRNRSILWNVPPPANGQTTLVFDTLRDRPNIGEHAVSTPRFTNHVELSVSIPDDLQMFAAEAWAGKSS